MDKMGLFPVNHFLESFPGRLTLQALVDNAVTLEPRVLMAGHHLGTAQQHLAAVVAGATPYCAGFI